VKPVPKTNGPTWEAVLSFGDENNRVVGIDEVGRGAWAGPIVAAAVMLPYGSIIEGINDSKVLSAKRRIELDRAIRRYALGIGIGWVSAAEVDRMGLSAAVIESGKRALAGLERDFDLVLLDGSQNYLDGIHPSAALVKGDALLPPVAAGSIVAKVARDRYMAGLDMHDARYQFGLHKGYGTAVHSDALAQYGISRHHRLSYKPLQRYLNVD
jgi:ribonuclease HII